MLLFMITMNSSATSVPLHALAAFNDNYIWLLHHNQQAVVVDPGDAQAVLPTLKAQNLQLHSILITHHHQDHTGGITELVKHYPHAKVYGPARETIPGRTHAVQHGDQITIEPLNCNFQVLDIPGHTAGHVAYFAAKDLGVPVVFCGDTLFSGGCGRVFEGTAEQMTASLKQLASLPAATLVCCAHEYTLSNLNWALKVEPTNSELQRYHAYVQQLRANQQITLPSTIEQELRINPFLRLHIPAVQSSAAHYSGQPAHNSSQVFAQLREWKNNS